MRKHSLLTVCCGLAILGAAHAQVVPSAPQPVGSLTQTGSSLDRLLNAVPGDVEKINPVREATLRDTAMVLGAQAGFRDRSALLMKVLQSRESDMDNKFRFAELMMGDGFMPPVISEAVDGVSLDAVTMRVFKTQYVIDEPARPVASPPNWRNWMLLGLDDKVKVEAPTNPQLLPQTPGEKAYWDRTVKAAYRAGSQQAMAIYELNLARMERAYAGMKRYYELYQRNLVTAPQIASVTDVVSQEDPNTIVIGNVLWRIVAPTRFNLQYDTWRPLDR